MLFLGTSQLTSQIGQKNTHIHSHIMRIKQASEANIDFIFLKSISILSFNLEYCYITQNFIIKTVGKRSL